MKKINNLEIMSLIIIISISLYSCINITLLKNNTGIDSWLASLLSIILGFIPIYLFIYISKYEPSMHLSEKINTLYPKTGKFINIVLNIIIATIGITILYNSSNFITSQLLYHTPMIVIAIFLISLSTYHISKGIDSICRVNFLLTIFNFFLFLISLLSLIKSISLDNYLPLLKTNSNNILLTSIKLMVNNTLPLMIILCIPRNKSMHPDKYSKDIFKTYLISSLISFIMIFALYGILGPYLINIFEYPEYMVLKKVTILGFLERIENIVSNQWLIGGYLYLTIIIYYLSSSIQRKEKPSNIVPIIISILFLIITFNIFKNNTIFNNYVKEIFPYITMSLFIFYILISVKIYITKRQPKKVNRQL